MTNLMKTLIATTAAVTLGTAAFADGHELNVGAAQIDTTLDTDGDGEVSVDEIIEGNMAFFDTDGNGAIDADERGVAENRIEEGGTITMEEMGMSNGSDDLKSAAVLNFDHESARLDTTLDTNGDGEVSNDEIIEANMTVFDTDGNGAVDADERAVAENVLMQ